MSVLLGACQRAGEFQDLELDPKGVLLVVVGVGTPESGKTFCESLPFPEENLFVDPARKAYKALELHGDLDGTEGLFFDPKVVEGVRRLFFTKITGERIKERGQDDIKAAMKNYKPLMPKESRTRCSKAERWCSRDTRSCTCARTKPPPTTRPRRRSCAPSRKSLDFAPPR